jgi:hypothetical protein
VNEYKGHLIVTETTPTGFIVASAIPDEGEPIRRRFAFYTMPEVLDMMRELIDEKID